jgi:asparaginyl-tRNA synthetase
MGLPGERGSNKFKFIVLRDSSNIIQCVLKKEDFEKKWGEIDKIQVETSMEIIGRIKADKRAPTGYEIHVKEYKIIGGSDKFPITKDQSVEFLLDVRHLSIRDRKLAAALKVKSTVLKAFRDYYYKKDYSECPMPILQPNPCEGGATLFEVKYYKEKTYLSQSWQLYAEATIFALEKIFTVSPAFRAERSKTSRHLSEFWMAEVETAWMRFPELLDDIEACLEYIVQEVVKANKKELELLGQDVKKLKKVKRPFPRMTYTEVLEFLKKKEKMNIAWGKDLRTVEEDKLSKHFDKPIIVTNYPKDIMAFYKPADPQDIKTALCVDVIAPEGYGEIVGGSERDTDIKKLMERLKEEGEKPENYKWYLDLRKYGSVPHSGYGIGVERLVAWLCKLDNIKDAVTFPRTMLRWEP